MRGVPVCAQLTRCAARECAVHMPCTSRHRACSAEGVQTFLCIMACNLCLIPHCTCCHIDGIHTGLWVPASNPEGHGSVFARIRLVSNCAHRAKDHSCQHASWICA